MYNIQLPRILMYNYMYLFLSILAFFLPTQPHPHDPDVDSMVGKPHFSEPGEETSGESDNTSTGLHTQSATNVESFAQFV